MDSPRPRPGQPAMERFIKDEIARQYGSVKRFLQKHDITDSTYYRVVADSPVIGSDQYRRIEGALDLPRYVLDYIADVNVPALEHAGLDRDQLRVILEQLPVNPDGSPRRKAG